MPEFFNCSGCDKQFNYDPDKAGKRLKCKACGAVTIAPKQEVQPDDDQTNGDASPATREVRTTPVPSRYRLPLLCLMAGYFPFLALLCLVAGALGAWFSWIALTSSFLIVTVFALLLGGVIWLSVFLILWSLRVLFWNPADRDEFEIELPKQMQGGLISLVEEVVEENDLPKPDSIRLHATSLAHVYQDSRGRSILVVGGLAVAALPQRALAGIIAHELGHFAAGDTAFLRRAFRWHQVIEQLERVFQNTSIYRMNPLAWFIRLYHLVFHAVWHADSRCAEHEADRHEVAHAGKSKAAAALTLVSVLAEMHWIRLGTLAVSIVASNQRVDQIFAEQVRLVRGAKPSEWEDAFRRAMKTRTRWNDSHPCLKDRLKAIGVSPKKALRLAMDLSGEPATALFPNWPLVEKHLTERIIDIVRANFLQRQEFVEVVSAIIRAGSG